MFDNEDLQEAATLGAQYCTGGVVVFVVNTDRFFLTHRASWGVAFRAAGARVIIMAADTGYSEKLRDYGFEFVSTELGRESLRPAQALRASTKLARNLKRLQPTHVFLVATAAYTLGLLAVRRMPETIFVRVVAGAGRALQAGRAGSLAARVVMAQSQWASRFDNVLSLFQIESDMEAFIDRGMALRAKSNVIGGTGVSAARWSPSEQNSKDRVRVLFASRLFAEKGIHEFVQLTSRDAGIDAEFVIAGRPDNGVSSSVTEQDIEVWSRHPNIEYLGHVDDMVSVFQSVDIFVFPSTHPEGTPKVLIEAAACGLAIVAYDQPGCSAVLDEGKAGILIEPGNTIQLHEAVQKVVASPSLAGELGRSARARAIDLYSIQSVLTRVFNFCGVPMTAKEI